MLLGFLLFLRVRVVGVLSRDRRCVVVLIIIVIIINNVRLLGALDSDVSSST